MAVLQLKLKKKDLLKRFQTCQMIIQNLISMSIEIFFSKKLFNFSLSYNVNDAQGKMIKKTSTKPFTKIGSNMYVIFSRYKKV